MSKMAFTFIMGDGIFFNNISGSSVLGNNVTLNKGYGIGLEYGPNAMIKGNYISKNNVGIWIGTAFYNNIISNTVIENNGLGIQLEGPHHDNFIYHNNFIDNNKGGTQASIAQIWTYPDLDKLFSKDPPLDRPNSSVEPPTHGMMAQKAITGATIPLDTQPHKKLKTQQRAIRHIT